MPLLFLGLIFVIGLFIYYLATTRVDKSSDEDECCNQSSVDDNLKKEENVIFLTGDIEEMKRKHKTQRK